MNGLTLAKNTKATLEMVLAMMLSGTIGYFVISSGQSFWNVVFFRCLIGAATLGIYAYFRGILPRSVFQKTTLLLIIFGGITLVGNWIFLFASFDFIPFSIATMAYHTQPLMLVLVSALIARQRIAPSLLLWLVVSFSGLLLVAELDVQHLMDLFSAEGATKNALLGLILALAAALLYTLTTLVTKRVEQVPSYLIALIQVCVGIVMLLPFVQFSQLPQSTMPWVDLIILGVVNTGFMYVIMYDAFQKLPTNLIAILSFIYPITALFVDYIAFSTQITLWQGIGVGLILLSVAAVKFNWNLARFRSVKRA
jgi:drug/metabolite transporter (DMT)-like permease